MSENQERNSDKEVKAIEKLTKDIKSLVYCLITTLMFIIIPIYLQLLL